MNNQPPRKIRPATLTDQAIIVDFNAALASETEDVKLDRAVLNAGVRAALEDSSKAQYFIAEINGLTVGQLMLTREWSDWRNGDIWWIQSVYVAAEHRRRGVFADLYRHVQQLAQQRGAVGLRLYVVRENHAAQRTYQAMGMSVSEYLVMEQMWGGQPLQNEIRPR